MKKLMQSLETIESMDTMYNPVLCSCSSVPPISVASQVDLGRDLDILDPKTPEDIYKSHLGDSAYSRGSHASLPQVDSARANLASTFVNAFVNASVNASVIVLLRMCL